MSSIPMETQTVLTHERNEMIDITNLIRSLVQRKDVREGYVIVFVPHTTASVTINENADPDVRSDLLQKLKELIPIKEKYYEHNEGNSDSHVKTSMVGNHVLVLIEAGQLILGQWQGIFFCEFDGPRKRDVFVKIVNLNSGT